uniref:Maturase K n=1 Tax=Vittaria graminifolia TaxID=38648 RepID=A0A3G5CU37_9MONI|nr:maturase K [Vittaria graminifolia]AYW16400.1 maturase K [Vittaria graminifolia]
MPKSVAGQRSGELTINKICFLYPFFNSFEEDSYLIDKTKYKSHLQDINIKSIPSASSTIAIKRLISSIHNWDLLETIETTKSNADLYLYPLLQLIVILLLLFLSFQDISYINSILETSKSIHSILLFLEDRFTRSNHGLKVDFPHDFHSETPIRLFRRQIQDVSFLHLLRIVFCIDKIFCRRIGYYYEDEQTGILNILIRNFYIFVIDSVLLIPWTEICYLQVSDFLLFDAWNIVRKERYLLRSQSKVNTISVHSYFNQRLCFHYTRWINNLVVVFGGTRYFTEKWKCYLHILLRYHFHFQTKSANQLLTILPTRGVSFLGYILIAQSISKDIWIKSQLDLYFITLTSKRLSPQISNSVITTILTKRKFCNIEGYPVAKLDWVSLTDNKIIDRYTELCQVFFFYYGASVNQFRVRQLIYLLQLSRDSTLTIKHKSTVRMLLYKFNLQISNPFLLFCRSKSLHNTRRVWWLRSIWFVFVEFSKLRMGM